MLVLTLMANQTRRRWQSRTIIVDSWIKATRGRLHNLPLVMCGTAQMTTKEELSCMISAWNDVDCHPIVMIGPCWRDSIINRSNMNRTTSIHIGETKTA